MAQLTLEQIKILADQMWEGCHGCDDMDKYMWTGGFVAGAISMLGTPSSEIEARLEKEDKTFKRKSQWTKVDKKRLSK